VLQLKFEPGDSRVHVISFTATFLFFLELESLNRYAGMSRILEKEMKLNTLYEVMLLIYKSRFGREVD
jgi:hypothetical protein